MIRNIFSQSRGENPAKSALKRITAPFGVAAMVMTTALSTPVWANDAPFEQPIQCSELMNNTNGFKMGAGANAQKYSEDNKGSVGIAVYPGKDMNGYTPDQIGLYLSSLFESSDVDARCFISPSTSDNHTGIVYTVNGLSWTNDGSLNLQQATDGGTVSNIVAEAKTGGRLLRSALLSSPTLNP